VPDVGHAIRRHLQDRKRDEESKLLLDALLEVETRLARVLLAA